MSSPSNNDQLPIGVKFKLAAVAVLSAVAIAGMAVTSPEATAFILGVTSLIGFVGFGYLYKTDPKFRKNIQEEVRGFIGRFKLPVLAY